LAVPFLDLKAQYRALTDEVQAALAEVLESCAFANGPPVKRFEQSFAQYVGSKEVVCVNSGTSALHLSLLVSGVGPGDEVIVPAMTFVATAWAVSYCGARPVFVDVSEVDYALDPVKVEQAITPRTKAIVPVHLYGLPADLGGLQAICQKHGLALIEDAAQAHGARHNGRHVGTLGELGCFSFYPGKNLGAYGEGGAIVTNDSGLAERLRALRDHGQRTKYHHDEMGFNYRMDSIQGAVLDVKLRHLDDWTRARQAVAANYLKGLADADFVLPKVPKGREHVWHLFVVLHPRRGEIKDALQAAGIGTGLHYPIPVPLLHAYAHLGHRRGEFPVSERIADQCLSLPMFAELRQDQQEQVVSALRRGLEGRG
jgi:dTDP-4-amino-4,6-dideoxygalactose transaminase